MQDDYFSLMQKIAPDLAQQIERRALVLERIDALQPVGRRMLASRLNLPEREVRTVAALLKERGLVELDAAGMTLTPEAAEILPSARRFSRDLRLLLQQIAPKTPHPQQSRALHRNASRHSCQPKPLCAVACNNIGNATRALSWVSWNTITPLRHNNISVSTR